MEFFGKGSSGATRIIDRCVAVNYLRTKGTGIIGYSCVGNNITC